MVKKHPELNTVLFRVFLLTDKESLFVLNLTSLTYRKESLHMKLVMLLDLSMNSHEQIGMASLRF